MLSRVGSDAYVPPGPTVHKHNLPHPLVLVWKGGGRLCGGGGITVRISIFSASRPVPAHAEV